MANMVFMRSEKVSSDRHGFEEFMMLVCSYKLNEAHHSANGCFHHVIAYVTSCMNEAQVRRIESPLKIAPRSENASGCLVGAATKAQAEQSAWIFHAPSIQLCWYAPMFCARDHER